MKGSLPVSQSGGHQTDPCPKVVPQCPGRPWLSQWLEDGNDNHFLVKTTIPTRGVCVSLPGLHMYMACISPSNMLRRGSLEGENSCSSFLVAAKLKNRRGERER